MNYYADDTILITNDEKELETLVREIEKRDKYCMKLHKDKCESVAIGDTQRINFTDGTQRKTQQ